MSQVVNSNHTSTRPGTIRSVVIAAVAAFALGALSALITRIVYPNASVPIAASGQGATGM